MEIQRLQQSSPSLSESRRSSTAAPFSSIFSHFIQKLIQSDGNFNETIDEQQSQQNTLIKLVSILYNRIQQGPFSTVELQKIGKIVRILGERARVGRPLNLLMEMDRVKTIEMICHSKNFPQEQQDLLLSMFGLYPQVRVDKVSAKSLPLFVPYIENIRQGLRIGNRNWQLARAILQEKFRTEHIQSLKNSRNLIYVSYQILLNESPLHFHHVDWITELWSILYKYYYDGSMNILITASQNDCSDPEEPIPVDPKYRKPLSDLRVNFENLKNKIAPNSFDLLSFEIIKIILQKREDEIDLFIEKLIQFGNIPQYEEGVLMALAILYKRKPRDSIKLRIMELARKRDMLQIFLPLVIPDRKQMVKFYIENRLDGDPTKIIMFQDDSVRTKLANILWEKDRTNVMDLVGAFKPIEQPLRIIESIPLLQPIELRRAIDYFKDKKHHDLCVKVFNNKSNSINELQHTLKIWSQAQEILRQNSNDPAMIPKISSVLRSQMQLPNWSPLYPPYLCPNWLFTLLNFGLNIAEQSHLPSAIEQAERMFLQASPYMDKVLAPEVIRGSIFPRLAYLLTFDTDLIQQMRRQQKG